MTRPRLTILALLSVAAVVTTDSHASQPYRAVRSKAVRDLQSDYTQAMQALGDEQAAKAYQARIKAIDRLAADITRRLRQSRTVLLDELLSKADPDTTAPAKPRHHRRNQPVRRASNVRGDDVWAEHQAAFGQLPAAEDPRAEWLAIRRYHDAVLGAALAHIYEQGRVATAVGGQSLADVAEMCFVLPLLAIPDSQWTLAAVQELPAWLRTDDSNRVLERFALRLGRFQTAHVLAQTRDAKKTASDIAPYLEQSANALTREKAYSAAAGCWRKLIEVAEHRRDANAAVDARFRLAELLGDIGQPALAADEVDPVIRKESSPAVRGKAVMLRLKYLYEAGRAEDVVRDGQAAAEDAHCRLYRPQILYITWVAHRQQSDAEAAAKVKRTFLKDYPRHVLGADMYFADAMSQLAASRYDEAARLLEIVEYRYPESRLGPKVVEIRKRLQSRTSTLTAQEDQTPD
jgi:tetratricopeptide (TPR) repeat protein